MLFKEQKIHFLKFSLGRPNAKCIFQIYFGQYQYLDNTSKEI